MGFLVLECALTSEPFLLGFASFSNNLLDILTAISFYKMHKFVNGLWSFKRQNLWIIVSVVLLAPRGSYGCKEQAHDLGTWGDIVAKFSTSNFTNAWDPKANFHLIVRQLYGLTSKEPLPNSDQVSARKLLSHVPSGNGSLAFTPVTGVIGKSSGTKKLTIYIVVPTCVFAFVASKIVLTVILCLRWSNNKTICDVSVSGGKMVLFQSEGFSPSRNVLHKTEQLTQKDVIGSGGYGTVYRLVLDDGTTFAVKKLARGDIERDRGFERELETLSDIKHRNLVPLCGYYRAPQVNLLYYELMTNGSLDEQLHEKSSAASPLNWPARFKIALGAARGISYLHHDCVPHVIHRDIKSSNILLDESMEAHISDFGLAKLMSPRETHVTTIIAGTLGYLAPEYVDTGKATLKGDVYSYGIVLLELVSGKRPTNEVFAEKGINLVAWVKAFAGNGHLEAAFDECLNGCSNKDELIKTIGLALLCVSPNADDRPTMNQVVRMLEKIKDEVDNFSIQ